jgi:hypothetical protein
MHILIMEEFEMQETFASLEFRNVTLTNPARISPVHFLTFVKKLYARNEKKLWIGQLLLKCP